MGLGAFPLTWRRSAAGGEVVCSSVILKMPPPLVEVDEELRRLLERLVDFRGPVWDGSVVLRLKERLDDHYFRTLTYGLHHQSVLSISTLIRTIGVLGQLDLFDEHDTANDFALELHLRCVVSALRVLKLHGAYVCAQHLTFDFLERLYVALTKWGEWHSKQAWQSFRMKPKNFVENYNNEFLIVLAKDLVASIACDRDLSILAVAKVAAGIPLAQLVLSPGIRLIQPDTHVESPKSLSVEVQRRLTPSVWHSDYRSIEDFIYYKSLLHERGGNTEIKGQVKAAAEELSAFSNQSDFKFLQVIKELIDKDTLASNAVTDTFERGTLPALAAEATQNERDTLETPPIARRGHFAFALMDLIQQHLDIFNPDTHFESLFSLGLDVASTAHQAFLRLKALELLFHIGRLKGLGLSKVENYFVNAMKKENKQGNLRKIPGVWHLLKKRMEELDAFRQQLSSIAVFAPSKANSVLPAVQTTARKLSTLITSLEELLISPIGSEITGELQLIPCANCSRLAWLTSDDPTQNYCTICSGRESGPVNEQVTDVLKEMKQECQSLESSLSDYKYDLAPRTPTRTEKIIFSRPPEPSGGLKGKISELPGRIFKRSDSGSSKRSINSNDSASDQRSLLRTSSELADVRGVFVRNRLKRIGSHTYEATAISADCKNVAIVGLADFTIFEVSSSFEVKVICWGDITQRYAFQPKQAIEQRSILSYHRAALTDEIIAIASFESFIDIRNAKTGQRIHQLRLEVQSNIRAIVFSPDGQHLAVGLKTGDIFVYHAGLKFEFSAPPIRVRYDHESPITSITISHDSLLMAASTEDNIVRAYRFLNLSDGHFEEWVQPVQYGSRNKPAPISDLAFLFDSHSLYLVGRHRKAPPIILTEITAPREDQRVQALQNRKLDEWDYKVNCCPRPNMLAAALITSTGEMVMTYLTPTGGDIWATTYHTERMDVDVDRDSGFCSVGFSDSRALALDRLGNLLAMDLILT